MAPDQPHQMARVASGNGNGAHTGRCSSSNTHRHAPSSHHHQAPIADTQQARRPSGPCAESLHREARATGSSGLHFQCTTLASNSAPWQSTPTRQPGPIPLQSWKLPGVGWELAILICQASRQ